MERTRGLGWAEHLLKKLAVKWYMKSRIDVTFKVVGRRGMGVRLGKLPTTRRHLEPQYLLRRRK
jgi:hypothetical protein